MERNTLAETMTRSQLVSAEERASSWRPQPPGRLFQECEECPELLVLPLGSYKMGGGMRGRAGPVHDVFIDRPIAVGKYEVTFSEWDACRRAGRCQHNPNDMGWGRGEHPVVNVSWRDAQAYVRWLSEMTGKHYRLLSESEWEYAARGETSTSMSRARGKAPWPSAPRESTSPVGTSEPNKFGLYDMLRNVKEWVEDCWHQDYSGAPADGSAWTQGGECRIGVFRGGSWLDSVALGYRHGFYTETRRDNIGFRVARTLD